MSFRLLDRTHSGTIQSRRREHFIDTSERIPSASAGEGGFSYRSTAVRRLLLVDRHIHLVLVSHDLLEDLLLPVLANLRLLDEALIECGDLSCKRWFTASYLILLEITASI